MSWVAYYGCPNDPRSWQNPGSSANRRWESLVPVYSDDGCCLSTLVQEKRRWLSDHAVAYLNVDTVLQGNYTFDMSATPSLKAAGIRATSRVGTAATVFTGFTYTNNFLRSVICFVETCYLYNCKISLYVLILMYVFFLTANKFSFFYIYKRKSSGHFWCNLLFW